MPPLMQGADARDLFDQALRHHQAGRLNEAVAFYRQTLALKPELAAGYNNLASALCELDRPEEAESLYRQALSYQPHQPEAHNNLGTLLYGRDKLDEAVACYRQALALAPDYAEALNNLGAALCRQGDLKTAEASIRRALILKPDLAGAYDNLGTLLHDQGRLNDAAALYRHLVQIEPGNPDALARLAGLLAAKGETKAALEAIRQSLEFGETARARRTFVDIVAPLRWNEDEPWVAAFVARALREPWSRPVELARAAASLIKQSKGTGSLVTAAVQAWPRSLPQLSGAAWLLAGDDLLCALLEATQNTDIALERFLTLARRALLDAALAAEEDDAGLAFHAALARQCFINEYVFAAESEEMARAQGLRDGLATSLQAGLPIAALQLVAVAGYFPLNSVAGAARLLDDPWPEPVRALLVQQLREPEEEGRLRGDIAQVTPVDDAVSRLVQSQYEENPYPRWVRIARDEMPVSISFYLRRKFPFALLAPASGGPTAEILSAGCGTGQLALEIAQSLKSHVLAVDLSRASLAYAARKARELALDNIEFAQADLLSLRDLGRRFDVIECSGVLHHLADPFAGWRALLPLLKPGGFMSLGLYSQTGRQDVVGARRFIAERGFAPSPDDIRRCRQELLEREGDPARQVASSGDFFGISSCRDLLFHAMEHRLTLGAIAAFLKRNGLSFLGFETDAATLCAYRRRFPADRAGTNLSQWEAFEADNPDSFSGMYVFWVQKLA